MKKLSFYQFVIKYRYYFLLSLIFVFELFLRFYQTETRNPFGWDQINNAWAAQKIIDNHEFPLLGFQAKLNSGIYVGPPYYYLISIIYFLTDLDPVASGIFAGITSIFTFFTLFYVTKKLFSLNVAIIAVFLNTFAFAGIMWDRIQGPANFIPSLSLIIFYSLYKIVTGYPKFIVLLSLALGIYLHVHLTFIFFPIVIALLLPFFSKTKEMFQYVFISFVLFIIFLAPSIIALIQNSQHSVNALNYGNSYYHGFHLTRVMQLVSDSLIQFEFFFSLSFLSPLKYVIIPIFFFFYLSNSVSREKLLLCYLVILSFLVPLLVLSTYSGEISDYYFSTNRFIVVMIIAFLIVKIYEYKNLITNVFLFSCLLFYAYFNLDNFFLEKGGGLYKQRKVVLEAINKGKKIEFEEGSGKSYLYYYYMRKAGKRVY